MRLLLALLACGPFACGLFACGSGGGDASHGSGAAAAAARGSSGGFSASLTAEINADNGASGSAVAANGSGGAVANSAPPAAAAPGSAASADPGSGNAEPAPPAASANGSAAAADLAPTGPPPAIDKTGPVTNHDTSKADTNAAGPPRPPANYAHVSPPAELAAIKLDMEPNWDRDFAAAGTISFVLRVPNTSDTRLFSFNYGYDLPGATKDRDAYKQMLADQHVLTVTLDRQRGAAWYLEGSDAEGQPAFRYVVVYGGKRLVCYGSLYKTHAATALGPDLRDKVVATAKKICETIAL